MFYWNQLFSQHCVNVRNFNMVGCVIQSIKTHNRIVHCNQQSNKNMKWWPIIGYHCNDANHTLVLNQLVGKFLKNGHKIKLSYFQVEHDTILGVIKIANYINDHLKLDSVFLKNKCKSVRIHVFIWCALFVSFVKKKFEEIWDGGKSVHDI